MNDIYIVIIDAEGFWDIPALGSTDNIYLQDKDALDTLLEDYEAGIYEMEILATDSYEGQRGEYGAWECAPYDAVTEIAMNKIGSVSADWQSLSQKHRMRIAELEKRLNDFARSLPDGYVLQPAWCNTIRFGTKITPDSWLVKPLKTYPNKLTEDNVEHIIRDVTFYLENEYFESVAPTKEEE